MTRPPDGRVRDTRIVSSGHASGGSVGRQTGTASSVRHLTSTSSSPRRREGGQSQDQRPPVQAMEDT
jgi:hypothetical protein